MTDLGGLSGEEFDQEFMRMLIAHDRAAVDESEQGLQQADHEDVNVLCRMIKSAQTNEIQSVRFQAAAWFGE